MLCELNIEQYKNIKLQDFRAKISRFWLSFASNPIDPCNLFLVARGKRGVCPSTSDITGPYIKSLSAPVSPSFIRWGERERVREFEKRWKKGERRLWKDRKGRERGSEGGWWTRKKRNEGKYEVWEQEMMARVEERGGTNQERCFFIVLWKNQGTIFYPARCARHARSWWWAVMNFERALREKHFERNAASEW